MFITGHLSEQWLLLDMIISDLWAISCSFVTLFYLITILFTGDIIMDGVILFLLLLISLVQFWIGYADSKESDFIKWQDLSLLPLYVVFYWFINLVSCLTALGSFFLDPERSGSWSSPDGGFDDEKDKQETNLIIRKRSSIFKRLERFIFLVMLWAMTIYIIYVNICFLLNAYSDTLVSDYLFLNLSYYAYARFAMLVLVMVGFMTVFGWLRIKKLEREAKRHEQDKS